MLYPFDTQTNSHKNTYKRQLSIDHICWYPICNLLDYYIISK